MPYKRSHRESEEVRADADAKAEWTWEPQTERDI